MTKNNFFSLAPNYEIDGYDNIDEILSQALTEKKVHVEKNSKNFFQKFIRRNKELDEYKNNNIAITGSYGSGKSSFLYSYLIKHNKFKESLVVTLGSLEYKYKADFDNNKFENMSLKKEKQIELERVYRLNDVEKSILQQILYSENPSKLKYSRYRRIDKYNFSAKKIFDGVIVSYFVFFLVVNYFNVQIFNDIFNSNVANFVFNILFIFCFLYIIFYVISNIDYISKFNFSFKSSSLELSSINTNVNSSVLNKNIEELLYFFKNSKKNIVVFEDFDRMPKDDSIMIFSRLREINEIINSSIHGNNIRFIYLLNDNFFNNDEYELRTKFFDYIIPIKPYAGIGNNVEVIDEMLNSSVSDDSGKHKKVSTKLDGESIKEISKYLENKRMINDFVNEFNLYYKDQMIKSDRTQLAFLILYKIIFPKKYDKLFEKDNIFEKYFESLNYGNKNEDEVIDLFCSNKEHNDIEKYMVKNKIIKPNYIKLITYRHAFDLSEYDEKIISQIRNNEIGTEYKFKNLGKAFDNINNSDFAFYSSFNIRLLSFALKSDRGADIANIISNNLTIDKLKILVDNEKKIKFFYRFSNKLNSAWRIINTTNDISSEIVNLLILYTIKYANISELEDIELITSYIRSSSGSIEILEKDFNNIKEKFLNYKFVYSRELKFPKTCTKVLNLIYQNNMYELTLNHIFPITRALGIEFSRRWAITSILSLDKDELLRRKALNNTDEFIKFIVEELPKQNDNDFIISDYVTMTKLSIENFSKIMNRERHKAKILNKFYGDYYNYLIENKCYDINWKNLSFIYEKEGSLKDQVDYINSDVKHLCDRNLDDDNLRNYILQNRILTVENLKLCIDNFIVKNISGITYIKDNLKYYLYFEYVELLAINNKIKISSDEQLRDVANFSEISDVAKACVLSNSFKNINSLDYFDSDVVLKLMDMHVNDINLFRKLLNYKHSNELRNQIYRYYTDSELKLSYDDLVLLLKLDYNVSDATDIILRCHELINNDNLYVTVDKNKEVHDMIFGKIKHIKASENNRIFLNMLKDNNYILDYKVIEKGKTFSIKINRNLVENS